MFSRRVPRKERRQRLKNIKRNILPREYTANPSRGGYKALETSADHTCCRIRPLLQGLITPTASLCVSKERCGPVGGGKPTKLAGVCFPRQPVKPSRSLEHRNTRHDRATAREQRLPLDGSREGLLVPVISFQSPAVEAPEETRTQSAVADLLPPAATVQHGAIRDESQPQLITRTKHRKIYWKNMSTIND